MMIISLSLKRIVLALPAILLLCIYSCQKYRNCGLSQESLTDCERNPESYDSLTLSMMLSGRWEWTENLENHDGEDGSNFCADKDVIIEFDSSGIYTVMEDDAIASSGIWTPQYLDWADLWVAGFEPGSLYLKEYVTFCEDYVVFRSLAANEMELQHVFRRVN